MVVNNKSDDKTIKNKLLYDMLLIRRFEEMAAKMYGLRKIGGFCHLYIGEEAVAAGAINAIDLKKDYVIAAYRDHGHALACGMDPMVLMAELYGKVTGCSGGKGGSMHLFDIKDHMYGGNGIVGGHLPLAAGMAYKIKYKKEDGVVLCFFGDGAIHQGAFHESLNLCKIYGLPVVYICENNQYGMGTHFRRVSSVKDFSVMAGSYGIPGKQIDGMDVLHVNNAVSEIVAESRKKKIPALLEIKTYRYKGHSMSDPAKYRTKDEVDEYRQLDPIEGLKEDMIADKLITEQDFEKMDDKIKSICKVAVDFAEKSDEPAIETLYEDVLV